MKDVTPIPVEEAMLTPLIVMSLTNKSSPMETSWLSVFKFVPSIVHGLLSLENARVFPIKIPGDLGLLSDEELLLYEMGSNRFIVPSIFTFSSIVVSSVPLYFPSIVYSALSPAAWVLLSAALISSLEIYEPNSSSSWISGLLNAIIFSWRTASFLIKSNWPGVEPILIVFTPTVLLVVDNLNY